MTHTPLRHNRDYVLLQAGQGLSTLGSESSQIAYPLLVLALTHSPAKAGVVGFARWAPYVLFAIPFGVVVDRWNRRTLMLLADGGRALALGSLVATLALHVASFGQIVGVAFVEGALYALFNIAETGALRSVVPAWQLPRAAAGEQSRLAAAQVGAPPLGGALFGVARLVPFVFDCCSYVFSVLSLLAIRTPFQDVRARSVARTREEIGDGWRWLRDHPFLWVVQSVSAGTNFIFEATFLVTIVLARRHGLTSAEIGLLIAVVGMTMLGGSFAAPILQRAVSMRAMALAQSASLLGLAAYLAVPNVYVLAGSALPAVFLAPVLASSLIGYRLAIAPEHLLGRINSIARTIAMSGAPLGALAGGLLIGAYSGRTAVTVLVALSGLLLVRALASGALRQTPSLDELRPTPSASRAATG